MQKLEGKENSISTAPELSSKRVQGQDNKLEKIKEDLDRLKGLLSSTSLAFTSLALLGENLLFLASANDIS